MKRPWLDTHIHVSDMGPDGKRRERMLADLLDVLDRCDANLRLAISFDGVYNSRVKNDPAEMMPSNRMIYDLVRRAPGVHSVLARVPSTHLINGTDWTTRVGPPFLPYGTLFGVKSVEENPFPPCVASCVGFLRDAGASEGTISQIAFDNAANLFKIR